MLTGRHWAGIAAALAIMPAVWAQPAEDSSAQERSDMPAGWSRTDLKLALTTWDDLRSQQREATEAAAKLAAVPTQPEPKAEWERLARSGSVGVIRRTLQDARELLERHAAAAAGPIKWERLFQLIRELHYSRDQDARAKLIAEWAGLLPQVTDAVGALVPDLLAIDAPYDNGKGALIGWHPRPEYETIVVERFSLTRAAKNDEIKEDDPTRWEHAYRGPGGGHAVYGLDAAVKPNQRYKYRLRGVRADSTTQVLLTSGVVTPRADYFDWENKKYLLAIVVVFGGAVVLYIRIAKSGKDLHIRKIAGLEAVEESVGRATEMGRPILFIPGIQDMNDIQTVAGLIILGRVARVAAEHDAMLEVPTSRSLVMTTAREIVATSYLNAGRPDAYDEKKIYYITDEQFSYVQSVTGTMVREKPATCIYMGSFFAESLILAETANSVGAIQIAGTAQPAQLPFFVAACDYTLIGEEFFAASAYLSGEPDQLGSLKGQDVGKLIVLILLTIGMFLALYVSVAYARYTAIDDWLIFLKDKFLNVAGF